ncbi:MAG: tRNA lysidine(34) synthetase TilS [Clostridiales bacterium]|nr:tRNA lysidine(34) synthetase TilS [Clostridiales bacterium]
MISKFLKTVNEHKMIEKGDRVCVGLSGGVDSVCLLHLLYTYREELGIGLCAVHINHGIRGEEAKRDETFSLDLCKTLGVECKVFSIDVPAECAKTHESTEECARRLRYEIFEKTDCDKIATAHNLNDNMETFFLNLARGASLSGLCGIPYVRDRYIRPLLDISREEIERYILENSLSFVTDSTNLCDDYTRNKIRHRLLPQLYEINPAFDRSFAKSIASVNMTQDYIKKTAGKLVKEAENADGYDITAIKTADKAIKNEAIREILKSNGASDIIREHIWAVSHIMDNGGSADLGGLRVNVDRNQMTFGIIEKVEDFEYAIDSENGEIATPAGTIRFKKASAQDLQNVNKEGFNYIIDCARICGIPVLRNRRPGDRLKLPKRDTKSLKQLFNEKKIPLRKRQTLFIVADDNGPLVLEGFGTDERVKNTDETKEVLCFGRMEDK